MALVKRDYELEQVKFSFVPPLDGEGLPKANAGDVLDIQAEFSFNLIDDTKAEGDPLRRLPRVRMQASIIHLLPPGISMAAANAFSKRLRDLVTKMG